MNHTKGGYTRAQWFVITFITENIFFGCRPLVRQRRDAIGEAHSPGLAILFADASVSKRAPCFGRADRRFPHFPEGRNLRTRTGIKVHKRKIRGRKGRIVTGAQAVPPRELRIRRSTLPRFAPLSGGEAHDPHFANKEFRLRRRDSIVRSFRTNRPRVCATRLEADVRAEAPSEPQRPLVRETNQEETAPPNVNF